MRWSRRSHSFPHAPRSFETSLIPPVRDGISLPIPSIKGLTPPARRLQHTGQRIHVVHTSTPSTTAKLLQQGPPARVVGELRVGRQRHSRLAAREDACSFV